ncbi:MAG: putative NUDIX family phosphoesterase [Planctomycetota bacterium]|jgi:predicted NUDIX family phosphoesterase
MEFVFVVPREKLFPDSYPHGYLPFGESSSRSNSLQGVLQQRVEEHGFYVEREYAERTPGLKQIIPYTIVERGGEVLCLTRTKSGGEARLHDKLSLGVGGHINPIDLTPGPEGQNARNPIARATEREVLEEELFVEGPHELRSVGLLNDDSNPVGAVHVGWVQVLSTQGDVRVREVDQLVGNFKSVSELQSMLEQGANFETWSSFLIPKLDLLISNPNCNTAPQPKHQTQ